MMKKIKFILLFIVLQASAQEKLPVNFSGYGELYYNYNTEQPANHENEPFYYNYKRHNELNLNLIYAKANYDTGNLRANLALMAGNYAQYNLASEPTWAQFIYEANLGFKISKTKNLWIDAGILPSHIGFETAVGADNYTLTRSILAENSPYYEMGAKLSYTNTKNNFTYSLLVLNGWQRIQRLDSVQKPSMGMQFTYKPKENITLNYSNFIGSTLPDSYHTWRVFHNLYTIYDITKKWSFIAGFDIGTDKYDRQHYGYWYAPVVIGRYSLSEKSKLAFRIENYNDKNQIVVSYPNSTKTNIWGYSINYDQTVLKNLLWRIECKYLTMQTALKPNAFYATTSLSYKF